MIDSGEELEEARGQRERIDDNITYVEDVIFDAEDFGLESRESKNIIEKARDEFDKEDFDEAERLAEIAKNKVLEKMP